MGLNNVVTFTNIDLQVHAPPGCCRECAEKGLLHTPTGIVFAYCVHYHTGSYRGANGEWHASYDISASDFEGAVLIAVASNELVRDEFDDPVLQ